MMKSIRISTKIYGIVAMALVIMAASFAWLTFDDHAGMVEMRKTQLAEMNQSALSIIESFHAQAVAGTITMDEARDGALHAVMAVRYGADGYFWINDMNHVMIAHPINARLVGQDVGGMEDPTGKRFFQEFVTVVRSEGAGFVEYYWPKPGFEAPVEKFSHVEGFAPWGWVIGTGVYVDDLQAAFVKSVVEAATIFVVAALATLAAAFAIGRSITAPLSSLGNRMRNLAEGDSDTAVPHLDRGDEIGSMAATVAVFREAAQTKLALEADAERTRHSSEEERQLREADKTRQAARVQSVIDELGDGLRKLAEGDLAYRITTAFGGEFDALRDDFNNSVARLQDTLRSVGDNARAIHSGAEEIRSAADEAHGATGRIRRGNGRRAGTDHHHGRRQHQACR
jgi:methyl-accepting chemotaxis protein